eukprot:gnl/TRDRNA2_/TRDRNA2_154206_c0_seq1.p1 gnl/TRDRNA2_/TRDRNA2_154206_c0~~gnl/TRDRNA2_/TRDRNA2_154206_c0_seq1.p1  ORF type:complete len:629 (+),score=191.10 gnl/TRDRNA2_/TRDRNA2_154206_c0_seq1:225-1889(+)
MRAMVDGELEAAEKKKRKEKRRLMKAALKKDNEQEILDDLLRLPSDEEGDKGDDAAYEEGQEDDWDEEKEEEMIEAVKKILAANDGEMTRIQIEGELEKDKLEKLKKSEDKEDNEELETASVTIPLGVLDEFFYDQVTDIVSLTGAMAVELLEAPSFNLAALEESYFSMGQEMLSAGLNPEMDERFQDLVDEWTSKREEIRELKTKRHEKEKGSDRARPLGPMTRSEGTLHDNVVDALKVLMQKDDWAPLSRLLDHPGVRRHKRSLPSGIKFWEWLDERFGEEVSMAVDEDGTEMLVHFTGNAVKVDDSKATQAEQEDRARELTRTVFELLEQRARDYPASDGYSLAELISVQAVQRLRFPSGALRTRLDRMPQTFEVFHTDHKSWCVRLAHNAVGPDGEKLKRRRDPHHWAKTEAFENYASDSSWGGKVEGRSPRHHSTSSVPGGAGRLGPPERTVEQWAKAQRALFKGESPLPEGWIRATSRTSGQIYFINSKTGETQYEVPKFAAVNSTAGVPGPQTPRVLHDTVWTGSASAVRQVPATSASRNVPQRRPQ